MSINLYACSSVFFFQAEDGIRDHCVTGVQTCALPILKALEDSRQRVVGNARAFIFDDNLHAARLSRNAHVDHAAGWRKIERSEERRVGKECRSRWSPYN